MLPQPASRSQVQKNYAAIAKDFRLPYEEGIIGEVLKDRSLKSDPIHPNARGYGVIAQRLAEILKQSGAI